MLAHDQGMCVQVLPLHPPVQETAERLQFVKEKCVLKVFGPPFATSGFVISLYCRLSFVLSTSNRVITNATTICRLS